MSLNNLFLKMKLARNYSYIHIYIYTNLLSTSIHGYQEKSLKKNRQELEIIISRITARGKK